MRKKKHVIYKYGRRWGVAVGGAILYEADFSKKVATRVAEMENSDHPPSDWFDTYDRLQAEGLTHDEIYPDSAIEDKRIEEQEKIAKRSKSCQQKRLSSHAKS